MDNLSKRIFFINMLCTTSTPK